MNSEPKHSHENGEQHQRRWLGDGSSIRNIRLELDCIDSAITPSYTKRRLNGSISVRDPNDVKIGDTSGTPSTSETKPAATPHVTV